jgi:formylmethanofuran dehydrogenase subunit E
MRELQTLLEASAERHHQHLCPRQVLGVRMGLYAGELLGIDLPRNDKRLFTFVESDGCMTDGIAVATGCWWGSRTMRLVDYGKTAATFVDTEHQRAMRIWPSATARHRAMEVVPQAPDRWHAQLEAYQVMRPEELLKASPIRLTVSLKWIINQHGRRVVCEDCGEDIINEREVKQDGHTLCRACAEGAYYADVEEPIALFAECDALVTA